MAETSASHLRLRRLSRFACVSFLFLFFLSNVYLLAAPLADGTCFAYKDVRNETNMIDFVPLYVSAGIVRAGEGRRLYDREFLRQEIDKVIAPFKLSESFVMPYGPHIIPVILPFSLLPLPVSYVSWCLVSLACGLTGAVLLLRDFRGTDRLQTAIFCLAILDCLPAVTSLRTGQVTWLVLGFLCLCLRACFRRQDNVAGVWLALAFIKLQYAVPLLLANLAARRYRVVLATVCTLVILSTLGAIALGWETALSYGKVLSSVNNGVGFGLWRQQMSSLRAPLNLFLPNELAGKISLGITVLSFALIWQLWRRPASSTPGGYAWLAAVSVVLMLVTSPHEYFYDCLLMGLPAILTVSSRNLFAGAPVSLRLWTALLIAYPAASWIIGPLPPGYYLGYLVMNVLLLIAGLVCISGKFGSAGQGAEALAIKEA